MLTLESFENYAKRTCQVLAVQELGSPPSDPVNPSEVITPKRIVRDAAKTNMTRNIIDERRKFPCTAEGCNMYELTKLIFIQFYIFFRFLGPSSKSPVDRLTFKEFMRLLMKVLVK